MQRPAAVSVFGILNVAIGGLGVCGSLWSIMIFFFGPASNNPVMKWMFQNADYLMLMKILLPIRLIISGVLIGAGIGLLQLQSWARKFSIAYAIYAIVVVLIMLPVNFFLYFRPMLEQAKQLQGPEAIALMAGAVGGIVGSALGWIYPTLLWVFMTRPKVVAVFHTPPPLPVNIA
jgi:hypothetical protein